MNCKHLICIYQIIPGRKAQMKNIFIIERHISKYNTTKMQLHDKNTNHKKIENVKRY